MLFQPNIDIETTSYAQGEDTYQRRPFLDALQVKIYIYNCAYTVKSKGRM